MRLLLGLWVVVAALCQQPSVEIALKDAFRGRFLVGAALNRAQYSEEDARALPLIARHFNTITPENDLKWERINPEPGGYRFDRADRFVAFGEKHGMFIVGHTLVWHSQTPKWVFEESPGVPASRELLLARMRDMSIEKGRQIVSAIKNIPGQVEQILATSDKIKKIAEMYANSNNFLYLGRGINFPAALEGALKMKEISYIHAEEYS